MALCPMKPVRIICQKDHYQVTQDGIIVATFTGQDFDDSKVAAGVPDVRLAELAAGIAIVERFKEYGVPAPIELEVAEEPSAEETQEIPVVEPSAIANLPDPEPTPDPEPNPDPVIPGEEEEVEFPDETPKPENTE